MLESFDYLVVRQEGFEPSAVGLEGPYAKALKYMEYTELIGLVNTLARASHSE